MALARAVCIILLILIFTYSHVAANMYCLEYHKGDSIQFECERSLQSSAYKYGEYDFHKHLWFDLLATTRWVCLR